MNLRWRLGALIAFSAILLSNHSSLAAESCEGLFTSPMQITTLESSAVFTLLGQYYKAPTATGRTKTEAELKVLENTIREALNERGINFEERSFNNGTLDINWTEFVISTKGTHPLNKAARSLNRKLGSVLVFNPLSNMEYGFTASFRWMENKLMVSREAVFQYFTHIDAHEVIHAHFLAQRLGKINFLPKAPVGIHLESRTSLDGRNGLYSHFMSFEELVTYAYDVTYSAKQTLKYISDPQSPYYKQNFDKTSNLVGSLYEIALNASLATQKAQTLLQEKKFELSAENNEQVFSLKNDDGSFKLNIFLPKNNTLAPEIYAAKQLTDASALALFTRSYFEALRGLDDAVILQKIRAFRRAQIQFIESL